MSSANSTINTSNGGAMTPNSDISNMSSNMSSNRSSNRSSNMDSDMDSNMDIHTEEEIPTDEDSMFVIKERKHRERSGYSNIFTPMSTFVNEKDLHSREEVDEYFKRNLANAEKFNGMLEQSKVKTAIRDPQCIRKYSNFSFPKASKMYNLVDYYPDKETIENLKGDHATANDVREYIDNETFYKIPHTYAQDNLEIVAPKLEALLDKIQELDEKDMAVHGKLFKHFIFSDNQPSMAGVKVVASGLISRGFHLGYDADLRFGKQPVAKKPRKAKTAKAPKKTKAEPTVGGARKSKAATSKSTANVDNDDGDDGAEEDDSKKSDESVPKDAFENMALKSNAKLLETPYLNFYMLSSKSVYGKAIPIPMRKEMLRRFNARPDNISGELSRIIIMDGGFKEGIDLFDIKYVHIFEPTITKSDQTQVIGRGTRTCGQRGLDFHPTRGWPLYVFVYDLDMSMYPEYFSKDSETGIQLLLQAMGVNMQLLNFYNELEALAIESAVDNRLNRKIHSFKASGVSSNSKVGGAGKKMKAAPVSTEPEIKPRRMVLPNTWLIGSRPNGELTYAEMANYVDNNFADYSWKDIVMKNNCARATFP